MSTSTVRSILHRTVWRTFEDVAILQLLSIRTLSKTLLQRLEGFRAQRILAGWTSDGDGGGGAFCGGGSGSVDGSYETFVAPVSTSGRVSETWESTHTWMDRDRFRGRENWLDDLYMFNGDAPGAERMNVSCPRDHHVVVPTITTKNEKNREVARLDYMK
jgi:hypothetical protein